MRLPEHQVSHYRSTNNLSRGQSYLNLKWDKWVFDVDGELLVPEGVQIFVDGLAFVHQLAAVQELDVGVGGATGVLGRKVVALLQVDVEDVGSVALQLGDLFVLGN